MGDELCSNPWCTHERDSDYQQCRSCREINRNAQTKYYQANREDVLQAKKDKRAAWKACGLCGLCGGERANKRFILCGKCRQKVNRNKQANRAKEKAS